MFSQRAIPGFDDTSTARTEFDAHLDGAAAATPARRRQIQGTSTMPRQPDAMTPGEI